MIMHTCERKVKFGCLKLTSALNLHQQLTVMRGLGALPRDPGHNWKGATLQLKLKHMAHPDAPAHPAASNVGLVVRVVKNGQYVYEDRVAESEANVENIIIVGCSMGVCAPSALHRA